MEIEIGPGSHILGRGTEVHGIVGNSVMTAAIKPDGNMHHLFWPSVGYPQHVKDSYAGVYCARSSGAFFAWLVDNRWRRKQRYLGNTNILETRYSNEEAGIEIVETTFVDYAVSLLVRSFRVRNMGERCLLRFFYYQTPAIGENLYGDAAITDSSSGVVLQYYRSYYIGLGFEKPHDSCVCGICESENRCSVPVSDGEIHGPKVAISIGRRGIYTALQLNLGEVDERGEALATLFISASRSYYHSVSLIAWARSLGYEQLLTRTRRYWELYTETTKRPSADSHIKSLYNRSVLTLKLLCDRRYGGIIAAPTMDPDYRYVWVRDATYIAAALDIAGHHLEPERFYLWCVRAQTPEGMLKQRYFPNPRYPGPYWSDQLDQLAIVVWGCKLHYDITRDKGFLYRVWPMIDRAADYLMHNVDVVSGQVARSGDIWEEGNVRHIYTAASVYAALNNAHYIAEVLNKEVPATWLEAAKAVREDILTEFWNEEKQRFIKRLEPYSDALDVSTLALTVPFKVVDASDPRMVRTAEQIRRNLRFARGGIGRFEGDPNYGGNPWPIATLWLSLYLAKLGRLEEAESLVEWTAQHATELGMLPEQVDKETGEPLSALPLGWSHAMYILATSMLYGDASEYL